ncbi:hypothetical protein ABZO31_03210 [Streptomyces sp. HUAS MG47]|uniref:hypothetical protein n=1 Tax=Streptomyces solicamelliae TaxID=3231716 RepID=UPI003877EB5A
MNAELRRVVEELRAALDERDEWRMMNALPAGARPESLDPGIPPAVREFLALSDGATCGDVTVFGSGTLPGMQFHCDPVEGAAVTLGREKWFCIGVISDEPFFVDRASGAVWYFPDTGVEWWMSSDFAKAADDFTTFFLESVAGPGHPRLTGAGPDDQWPELLEHLGRLRA